MTAIKETEIQTQIINFLQVCEDLGMLVYQRINNGAIFDPRYNKFRKLGKGQKRGFADIWVLKRGRSVLLEVKTPTGKQSQEQKWWEKKAFEQGGEYYVVRSLEEVQEVLS